MKVVAGWVLALLMVVAAGVVVEASIGVRAPAVPRATAPVETFKFQVFVDPAATTEQVGVIGTFLRGRSDVTSCTYLDHRQSYALMQQVLAGDPQALQAVTPSETPTLFWCRYRGTSPARLARSLKALPKIDSVDAPLGAFPFGS